MSKEGDFLKSLHQKAWEAGYDDGVNATGQLIESLGVETEPHRFYEQDTMTEEFEGWWYTQIEDEPIENWIPDSRQTKFLREWLLEAWEMGHDSGIDAAGRIKDAHLERQFLQDVFDQDRMKNTFNAWWDTQIKDGMVKDWIN